MSWGARLRKAWRNRCQCYTYDGGPYGREHYCKMLCPQHGPCLCQGPPVWMHVYTEHGSILLLPNHWRIAPPA